MTDYIVTDTELISVANAIRAKGDTAANLIWPSGYIAAINAIPTGGVTIVDWATGTDEEIAAMIDAAHNGTIDLQQDGGWAVGDVRRIAVSAFTPYSGGSTISAQNVDIVITSFDEYMSSGNILQFDFLNAIDTNQAMNASRTNSGGYSGSRMKTQTLPALVNALPEWIKTRLIEFSVLAGGGGSSGAEAVTGNKLALRSYIEIFNSTTYSGYSSVDNEGVYVPYYSDATTRKKKTGVSGSYTAYWVRSPQKNNTNSFLAVYDNGDGSAYYANNAKGVAPFGCL